MVISWICLSISTRPSITRLDCERAAGHMQTPSTYELAGLPRSPSQSGSAAHHLSIRETHGLEFVRDRLLGARRGHPMRGELALHVALQTRGELVVVVRRLCKSRIIGIPPVRTVNLLVAWLALVPRDAPA